MTTSEALRAATINPAIDDIEMSAVRALPRLVDRTRAPRDNYLALLLRRDLSDKLLELKALLGGRISRDLRLQFGEARRVYRSPDRQEQKSYASNR